MKPIFSKEPQQGAQLLLALAVSTILMVVDMRWHQFDQAKALLSVLAEPLYRLVDWPFRQVEAWSVYWKMQQGLLAENQSLQAEHLQLQGRLQKLLDLEAENHALRALLHSGEQTQESLLIASILHVDPDPFTHQVVLDRGASEGVYVGQPIIDAKGIMGTVISVDRQISRVLLLCDGSHGVPVKNHRNGVRAIAIGTGAIDKLALQYVPNTTDIAVGDLMLSSGLGGRYPKGFPVGVVTQVNRDQGKPFASIVLSPCADLERSQQVLLIQKQKAKSSLDDLG